MRKMWELQLENQVDMMSHEVKGYSEVFVLTPLELEERERKAFLAGRAGMDWKNCIYECFSEYKESKEYKE